MIVIATASWAHYVGDAIAWFAGFAAARWQYRTWPDQARSLSAKVSPGYFLALAIGALLGAWLFGSINSLRTQPFVPSHSIAGALAGGIIAVELWKSRKAIRQSTGSVFVLPLCTGIVVGRFGCLFAGLPDFTYGTPSTLPWAVDLGDGIARHPVQIYEAVTIALFTAIYLHARFTGRQWADKNAFHIMIIVYAFQRFLWEFLKPYPTVIGPLNSFHLLMLGMISYGIIWWYRSDRQSRVIA